MLLDPTYLVKSSEDMMRATSCLLVGLKKKEFWALFFRKSEKCLWECFDIYFSLRSNARKVIVENISNLNLVHDSTIICI